MKSINFGYHILHNFIPALISLVCFGFVALKITDCVEKYSREPVTNIVTIEGNEGLPFPKITVCPSTFGSGVNNLQLSECNLTIKKYQKGHDWIGNCTDPEQLFNDMVKDFDELVTKNYEFTTKDGNKFSKQNGAFYEPIDSLYGRCYSIIPKNNVSKQGIVESFVTSEHQHLVVHLSSNGEFLTGKYG